MTTEAPAQEVPLDREAILRERRRQKVLAGADKRRGFLIGTQATPKLTEEEQQAFLVAQQNATAPANSDSLTTNNNNTNNNNAAFPLPPNLFDPSALLQPQQNAPAVVIEPPPFHIRAFLTSLLTLLATSLSGPTFFNFVLMCLVWVLLELSLFGVKYPSLIMPPKQQQRPQSTPGGAQDLGKFGLMLTMLEKMDTYQALGYAVVRTLKVDMLVLVVCYMIFTSFNSSHS